MFIELHAGHSTHQQDTPDTTPDADELSSLNFYASFNRWMNRQWKRHLSLAERSVLDYVFDRTIGWGKEWEAISLRHLQSGFKHELAHCASKGTGLSVQACVSGLRALCASGLLRKKEGQGRAASQYAINFNWTPDNDTPTYTQAMLKLPKSKTTSAASALPSRAHPSTELRYKREKEELNEQKLATQAGKPGATKFDTIVAEIKSHSEKRAAKAKASNRFTVLSLEAIYQHEWTSAFPDTPPVTWKKHEGHALKQWGTRFQGSTRTSFSEMFAWCVSRWRQIMAHEFKTFKGAPAFPAVGFMVKFSDRFQAAYARRAELERRAALTERDTAIASAMDKGMDQDAAERHADERLGLQGQKDAITRERRRLLAQQMAAPRIPIPIPAAPGRVAIDCKTKTPLSAMMSDSEYQPYEEAAQ